WPASALTVSPSSPPPGRITPSSGCPNGTRSARRTVAADMTSELFSYTREQAIDVLWTAMMTTLPLGSDQPNTDDDKRTATAILAAFTAAMETVGVTFDEIKAAQVRYADNQAGMNGP